MRLPLPRHVLAVPLAVVALAGCGSSGGGASGRSPGPADVMPKSSVFYLEAAVRPDGDQATAVTKLLSRVMRTGDPGAKLRRLIDEHLAAEQPGVTYEHDIAPWLGDRVGMTATNLATGEPGLVAAVTVRDVARAKAFVAAQEARERAHKRAYHGTAYYAEDDGSVTGVVEDFVVIADTEAGFKRAVDTAGGDGLSDVARFDDAVDELPSDRVGMLYVDPQRLADAAGAAAGDPTAAGVLSTAVDGLGVITAFARAGEDTATLESRVTVQEGSTGAALASLAAGGAPDLVKSLPADSWAAFGMAKLGETLTSGLDSLAGGLGGAVLGGQLQQRLGIDIQQDLLSWMGDVAVFVRGDTPAQVRGGLVVQATDEAKAAAALPRLVAAARSRGGVDFQDVHM